VPVHDAIAAIDLADAKQMVVVTGHESRVLARRTFRQRAWELGAAVDWAAGRAAAAGFGGVTVAAEPAGHRWRVAGQLAAGRGMPFVCVQPLLSSWARRAEDLTSGKTDLLTELTTRSFEELVRSSGLVARFAARDQRRGCATGSVATDGAAGRVA
jgi:hypothetical protein